MASEMLRALRRALDTQARWLDSTGESDKAVRTRYQDRFNGALDFEKNFLRRPISILALLRHWDEMTTVKSHTVMAARILSIAVATLFFAGCHRKPSAALPPPVVEVVEVQQQDVPIYHDWIGSLDGFVNAQIRAEVAGYLLTQNYREGDPLKKGDLLFQIDPRPFEAVLDQAKGQLAQAEAQAGKTELDVKRFTPLAKTSAISQQELDDAVHANQAAQAAVASAKAAVKSAEVNLEFTRIVSPINGIPGIARAQIGDLVGPSTGELTTVSTLDPIKLYYYVTEQAYINFTRLFGDETVRNQRVQQLELSLILADGTTYAREGRIYAVDREVDPTTGALRVEALFPNPDNTLRPGQFGRAHVKFETRKGALLVPQRAVTELQGSYQVALVAADNKVHIQPVKVGDRSGTAWIIEQGLKAGDRVVVEGIQKVREGTLVSPKPHEGPTAPKAGAAREDDRQLAGEELYPPHRSPPNEPLTPALSPSDGEREKLPKPRTHADALSQGESAAPVDGR